MNTNKRVEWLRLLSEEAVELEWSSGQAVILRQAPFQGGLRIPVDELEGFAERLAAAARELRAMRAHWGDTQPSRQSPDG